MKRNYLLLLLSILSLNLFCQVYWTKHPDNPVMVPGSAGEWDEGFINPGSIIYYDSTYHMWYDGNWNNSRIGHATSPDGITWTKDTNNPILEVGQDGAWDDNYVWASSILIIDSIFHMWYTGHDGEIWNKNYLIGHATSTDGSTWTKDTINNPVLGLGPDGTWDDSFVILGSVVYKDSEYHMWYGGWEGIWNPERIGHATSPDGITWTKDPSNPVLISDTSWETNRIDGPKVIFDGTTFRMWYSGGNNRAQQIGYATSEDGSSWTKYANNPVLRRGSTGSWDDIAVMVGSVIDSSGVKYKMWYCGFQSDGTGSIGYAESRVPAWTQMNSMNIAKGGSRSCVIDSMIYVFGGLDRNIQSLNSAEVYNIETDSWSDLAPVPVDLYLTSAGAINDKIYLVGGWRREGSWFTINSTFEYDPVQDSWNTKKECPKKTGDHASCVLNDKLYLFGGLKDFPDNDTSGQKDALVYDPATDTWDSLPDMSYGRADGATASVYDGQIFVFGGQATISSTEGYIVAKPERYDPGENTWTELAAMPVPVLNHLSLVYEDKIYLLGGDSLWFNRSYCTNLIQEYDPSTDSWRRLQNMPFNRSMMTGQNVDNFVYLIGGYPYDSRSFTSVLSEVWRFDLESLKNYIPVWGISLDKHAISLSAGYTKTLVPTVSPFDASDPSVSWTSSNPSIATVNNGTVKGVAGGETYVYVTSTDGRFKDSCLVTVTNIFISQVRFGSTGDPLNGLTVTWNSNGASDSIKWGYSANLEEGTFEGSRRENTFGATVFDYTFPSLTAGSTIHYALFDSNDSTGTEERTFITATDASSNQFSFTVLGDSRTYPDQWGIISEAAWDTDFTLFMGDIIANGAVQADWDKWFEYGAEFIAREPVYHCVGNHDDDNSPSGFDNFLSLFTLPGNELYYSFNYGNAVFICLNTQEPGDTEQYNWLLSTLEANKDQTWKIVFFHKPFYTSPSHVGAMDGYFDTWWQAFDDYGVDMIFNGHTHNYQRTRPINRNISTTSPVEYYGSNDWRGRCQVVSGAAGAPLSGAADPGLWWLDNSASKLHFCNIDIDGDMLTFKAIDANQVVFDELVLDKSIGQGINDFRDNNCRIYPNPANDLLSIETNRLGKHAIEITSLNGQLIYSTEMEGTTHQLDLSSFKIGIYFITVRSNDFVTTRKIIKL